MTEPEFSVQTAGLRRFAQAARAQQVAAAMARIGFVDSPAVADADSKMIPTDDSMADYAKAVQGIQNQLRELATSLGSWSQAFEDAATTYDESDSVATQTIWRAGGIPLD